MAKKFLRFPVIAVLLALVFFVFRPAQSEETPTHKLSGTVIYLDKTEVRILYETGNSVHFISGFKIAENTQIKGALEIGSWVTVTFTKKRILRNNIFKRIALIIEVVQASIPEQAVQPGSSY
jgi:hypothetical protein